MMTGMLTCPTEDPPICTQFAVGYYLYTGKWKCNVDLYVIMYLYQSCPWVSGPEGPFILCLMNLKEWTNKLNENLLGNYHSYL